MDSNRVAGFRLVTVSGFVLRCWDLVEGAVKALLWDSASPKDGICTEGGAEVGAHAGARRARQVSVAHLSESFQPKGGLQLTTAGERHTHATRRPAQAGER